jgi:hypothetical protein
VKAYVEAEGQIRTYQPVKPAKPKESRVPKTRAGGEFSEARFWGFIRSGLRQMSQRWPPTVRLIWLEGRRAYKGPNARQKWEYKCDHCEKWWMRKEMEADHIIPCGSMRSWEELPIFAERLLCETSGLRRLCNGCHLARTNEVRGEKRIAWPP